ncbi:hypothetical protein [Streptomyces atriruber]|uniref:hypothetical protein n=1 Tax=Streptomyces atriruber TaxID=545121 RepID=UPI0006E3DD5F|nr:hypothetical protein [Streptomyces atriruber]
MGKYTGTIVVAGPGDGCITKSDGSKDCSKGAKQVVKTVNDTGPDLAPVSGFLPLYGVIMGVLVGAVILAIAAGAVISAGRGGIQAGFKKDGSALKKTAVTVGGLIVLLLGVLAIGPSIATALGG